MRAFAAELGDAAASGMAAKNAELLATQVVESPEAFSACSHKDILLGRHGFLALVKAGVIKNVRMAPTK